MLESLDPKKFYESHFEKEMFFSKNAFKDLDFSWNDLSETIFHTDPSEDNAVKLIKNELIPEDFYTEIFQDVHSIKKRFIFSQIEQLMELGATLVLNRIDRRSRKISKICNQISRDLEVKTTANAYAAFGGEGTFGKHWDTHDVFAIQLLGKKLWKVYRPTFKNPLSHHKSASHKSSCPQTPVFEGFMEKGDILYIPRGWWHEAIPLKGEETLHIAVGVHVATFLDYVEWLVHEILPEIEVSRASCIPRNSNEIKEFSNILLSHINDERNFSLFQAQMKSLVNKEQDLTFPVKTKE